MDLRGLAGLTVCWAQESACSNAELGMQLHFSKVSCGVWDWCILSVR